MTSFFTHDVVDRIRKILGSGETKIAREAPVTKDFCSRVRDAINKNDVNVAREKIADDANRRRDEEEAKLKFPKLVEKIENMIMFSIETRRYGPYLGHHVYSPVNIPHHVTFCGNRVLRDLVKIEFEKRGCRVTDQIDKNSGERRFIVEFNDADVERWLAKGEKK